MAVYSCDNEDGNMAVVMVTRIETGEVMAFCANCVPLLARSMLAAYDAANHESPAVEAGADTQREGENGAGDRPPRPSLEIATEAAAPARPHHPEPTPQPEPDAEH